MKNMGWEECLDGGFCIHDACGGECEADDYLCPNCRDEFEFWKSYQENNLWNDERGVYEDYEEYNDARLRAIADDEKDRRKYNG